MMMFPGCGFGSGNGSFVMAMLSYWLRSYVPSVERLPPCPPVMPSFEVLAELRRFEVMKPRLSA